MFKWPTPPSVHAPRHELADFAELTCWQDARTSATSLSRLLGRLADNDYSQGVPEEEDTDRFVENAYDEIERRQEVCRDGYPFVVKRRGSTLQIRENGDNFKHTIYKFLLLATRLNMNNNKCHAGIDGTRLLEKLAAEVAREYFGSRAKSLVFGTAAGSVGFQEKVRELCDKLREGGGFVNRNYGPISAKDDKLDVVVWKPFFDALPGKLIGFGQCKTGTHYKDSLRELQPDSFVSKWMRDPLAVSPVRMFFISEALSTDNMYGMSIDAGVLFDRCRMIDFCDGTNARVLDKVREWTAAAAAAVDLSI